MEMYNPQISIFKHAKETQNPFTVLCYDIFDRIAQGRYKEQIGGIRTGTDEAEVRRLKSTLPCICFSGVFKTREDRGLITHSGLTVLDFDKLSDPIQKKKDMAILPYVYAAFISPSGNGLKVVVRIPADASRHAGHYRALLKLFPNADPTSKNISRVCYESYDPDIYTNYLATQFTEYVEDLQKARPMGVTKQAKHTNYAILNIAAKKIRFALDGKKHEELLKASRLMGGYIASGLVEEEEANRILENEIGKKDIDDMEGARKTIKDGIEHGKINPIVEEERGKINITEAIKSHKILQDDDNFDFVADEISTLKYLESVRDGSFQMGLTTGISQLDEFYRMKQGNVVVINGFDNVGKSTVLWYIASLSVIFHDWNWIIFSAENKSGGIMRKLIEFKECRPIKDMSEAQYMEAYKWVNEHFTILKNHETYTYKDILAMSTKLFKKKSYNAVLIDPYNSLHRDKEKTQTVHDYDYEVMGDVRQWAEKFNCSVYINCHVQTDALRRTYPLTHQRYAGLPSPPGKADTEGGGKFSNRCDDFITIHRMTTHPEDWMWTEIHVRKIRENETGGKQTIFDKPVRLRMLPGGCGFEPEGGVSPIRPRSYENTKITFIENTKITFIPHDGFEL
jgi:hypothetical protein